jgi:DNA/RNA-binding domain of Phe-tRNA-synthetase-like protein
LLRRAASGLPRVNRVTDLYNALSVLYQTPLGGEDLSRYTGCPRLIRASGDEPFNTIADGAAVIEHPERGEVIWCDDSGSPADAGIGASLNARNCVTTPPQPYSSSMRSTQ